MKNRLRMEHPVKTTISENPDFQTLPVEVKKMLRFSEDYFSNPATRRRDQVLAKERLTFGDFVAGVYRAWGERRAKGIVQLAIKMNVVEFRGAERFVIS